jgi:hypothetical protein
MVLVIIKKKVLFYLGCDDRISVPYKFTYERLAKLTHQRSSFIEKNPNFSGTFGYLLYINFWTTSPLEMFNTEMKISEQALQLCYLWL